MSENSGDGVHTREYKARQRVRKNRKAMADYFARDGNTGLWLQLVEAKAKDAERRGMFANHKDALEWAADNTSALLFADSEAGESDDPDDIRSADDVPTLEDAFLAGATKRWLWQGWLLADAVNGLVGKFGDGKTRLVMDLIRRVCAGKKWPDGQPVGLPADSKFLFVPLDYQHAELIDLADEYGVPRRQVYVNAPEDSPDGLSPIDSTEGLAALERRIEVLRPAMVVIDPITAASSDRNQGRPEDVTALYAPMQKIARKYRTMFLALIHTNAQGGTYGRHSTGKFRVELKLTKVGDDDAARYRLEVTKSNSKKPEALGAGQGDAGWVFDRNPPEPDAAGPSRPGRKPTRLAEAMHFLRAELSEGDVYQVKLIEKWTDAGHAKRYIFDAAKKLEAMGELAAGERESPTGAMVLKTWKLCPPVAGQERGDEEVY